MNDPGVNDSFAPDEIRVPFRNMIYIGDSDTDIPCMKLVNSYGGSSIGVYSSENSDKAKVYKMMREERIRYYAPADYSEGKELDSIIKSIIDRTVVEFKLNNVFFKCKKETDSFDRENSEEGRHKIDLINALDNSRSFATTHMVIAQLTKINRWDDDEKEELFSIAIRNGQVFSILKDEDIKLFYRSLIKATKVLSTEAQKVKKILDEKE